MSGFAEQRRALVDGTFAAFGQDACWPGHPIPVRIRIRARDEEQRFGASSLRARSTIIQVRGWEVADPAEDQVVTVADGPDAGGYRIVGDPELDAKGVWSCGAVRQP